MRRLLYFVIGFLCISSTSYAQTRESVTQVGAAQGAVEWNNGQDSALFVFNVGGLIQVPTRTVGPLDENVSVGFPYPARYFSNVFAPDFFISKGYFPDVIQLQWNIESNADRIERFLIYRKPLGSSADSTLVASISADDFSFSDETIQQGTLYKYTVFAQGIIDEFRIPFINIIEDTGFAFPVGSASGRITYEGGTAVDGVTIIAETDGNLRGQSILLDGTDDFLNVNQGANDPELFLNEGFTLQLWTDFEGTSNDERVLFSKGSDYRLAYDGETIRFRVHNDELELPFVNPVDSFFHISAVFDPGNQMLRIHALVSEVRQASTNGSITTFPNPTQQGLLFGRDLDGNFYHGYLEEIRLWNTMLPEEEILSNYSRFISGQEDDLAGYWKLDAGVGEDFYDFAQPNPGDFTENHGQVFGAEFSGETPLNSQLAFRGITDANGNYTITGFPFESSGSLYRFTPTLGIHAFEPTERIRFVGPSEAIHNEMDFDDVSSFPVSGTVFYSNTDFPVDGVSILIDGQTALDREGNLITSDNLGRFTVDVPIGFHSLQLSRSLHVFENEGRFPLPSNDGSAVTFDFQESLAGLQFFDSTLVRFTGKVVGGPAERDKVLGFGRSIDNIGNATISMSPEKGFSLTKQVADSVTLSEVNAIESITTFNSASIVINADENTGEFIALLPPEKYSVTDVRTTQYTFDNSFNVSLDFTTFFEQDESIQDTLAISEAGEPRGGFPPFDPLDYEAVVTETQGDVEYTFGLDTFRYDARQDFILRLSPSIDVTNEDGGSLFGDETFTFEDNLTEVDVPLIENDSYTFGHPVFSQNRRYRLKVSVFEEYLNDDEESDRVPVSDGTLEIVNDFAIEDEVSLPLDASGRATYTFSAGLPSLSTNAITPENSFTRPLTITAVTGDQANIRTDWNSGDPLLAYVFGGIAQGNSFVTNGPTEMVTILRDPPGSNSFAFIESGQSIEQSKSWSAGESFSEDRSVTVDLGIEETYFFGLGAGTIETFEVTNDITAGLSIETSYEEAGEETTTITTTRTISTDELFPFIGSIGDLFIGYSTNLVYGSAITLQPIPSTDEECVTNDCSVQEVGGFRLGRRQSLRMNPEFATSFVFSQLFIEDELLPELKSIRNGFLTYVSDPDGVTTPSDVTYLSLVPPDDPRFGSANNDIEVWGDEANPAIGEGPSYRVVLPAGFDVATFSDTVNYYNNQIGEWVFWLTENERQKVEATLTENISIDGGGQLDETITIEESSANTRSFAVELNATLAQEFGFEISDIGVTTNISTTYGVNGGGAFGNTSVNATTYGYTIQDDDGVPNNGGTALDFHSVDVKTPADGFGPVFVLRAGATSCPYEGEELTQYYEPGRHVLQFATLNTEKVDLIINNPIVNNVPENREAEIGIQLINQSESENSLFFRLGLNNSSNPNGAIVSVDGRPLDGEGRSFLVNFGEVLNLTVTVAKGAADVFDYEDIGLRLISECNATILEERTFSVFFQPGCSDINLVEPLDQWVLNTNASPAGRRRIVFDQYDLQNENFEFAAFQYKPASSSTWITSMRFYNPNLFTQEEFDLFEDPKAFLDESGTTTFDFDMSDLPDREYDVRVLTSCATGGDPVVSFTDVASGVKDTQRPRVFGAPQPSDGILSAGDEISVRFSEPIEEGLLTPNNFSIRGVLNNTPITNNTSVKFDGVNDYMRIEDGLTMANDFTVFFWLRREVFGEEYVIFSKGIGTNNELEIGFNAANQFMVNVSGQVIESSLTFPTTGDSDWEYYAVTYRADENKLSAYRNGAYVLEDIELTNGFTGEGSIAVGKSVVDNNRHFEGNIHELRIWNTFRQITDVIATQSISLSGRELGLVGYWPMKEGSGDLAIDKARSRNGILFADWQIDPQGYSVSFDGLDDFLEISTESTVTIFDDQDFTIEFWFNAASGQTETVLFSSGKADGSDVFSEPDYSWNIGIGSTGELFVLHNGTNLPLEGTSSFVDDNWHHFALSLNRTGNLNVFIDEMQQVSVSPDGFGGLAGAEMWIGARGYKIGTTSSIQDQFFDGFIDEFRIWNTARRSNQLSANLNIAQESDEIGLAAYYPFEFFEIQANVPIRTASLEDLTEESAGLATASGGTDFSMNTANIRVANPISSIDFDWVVNGDEIIFNIAESFSSLIEQSVLNVAVRGVEDLLQNRLANPISWTAFIDQNQVKWDLNDIEIEKEVYRAHSFEVAVLNLGGTEESFEITNLPPWLEASPSNGSLAPNSSSTVQFNVNPGLNTGYYQEDIFLTTDFGFDEKLSMDLSVFSPAPNWKVSARDFQYSMNVVGQVEIQGFVSRDVNDLVAAFVNNEIRGVTNVTYVEEVDAYLAYLTVYSNVTADEEVELRVWDASDGFEYRENIIPDFSFTSNQVLGSDAFPVMIQVGNTVVQEITLERGWNWVSFAVDNPNFGNLDLILQNLPSESGFQIKTQEFADIYNPGIGWRGSLSNAGGFESGEMYRFFVGDDDLEVVGVPVEVAQTPISLAEGWNWLGFTPRFNQTVNEALAGLQHVADGDIIKSQFLFAIYRENIGWLGTLEFMEPGKGYLIRKANADTFTYPETTGLSRQFNLQNPEVVSQHDFEHNMTLVSSITGLFEGNQYELQVVDEIGNFRGSINGTAVGQEYLYFLTVQGNAGERLNIYAQDLTTGDLFKSSTQVSFNTNEHLGSLKEPIVFDFESTSAARINEVVLYPNPFVDLLSIRFAGEQNQVPQVTVADLSGRQMKVLDFEFVGGNWIGEWNGSSNDGQPVNPGIYLLTIRSGDRYTTHRISFK